LRAISKLPLLKFNKTWSEIIGYLSKRLPLITETYAIESTFDFLLALPFTHDIVQVVADNISLFSSYKWE